MLSDSIDYRKRISYLLKDEGLEPLGFVKLSGNSTAFSRFRQWLSEGKNAGMTYMKNHQEIRRNPEYLQPGLRQSILFAMPYFLGDTLRSFPPGPRIAQYARIKDYHKTMRNKAQLVLAKIQQDFVGSSGRITVDTAPILERDLAARTGRGFIGKNTCFIDPERGSFFLLGAIHLNIDLVGHNETQTGNRQCSDTYLSPRKRSDDGGCGSCKRCQVYCPTGALDKEYTLDANKCLSYWTIEHRGTIPTQFWKGVGRYWFGCDICQLACPYNRKAQVTKIPPIDKLANLDLYDVATMSQIFYENTFGGSPMTRAKRIGLQRNALIAMFVTNDNRIGNAVHQLLATPGLEQVLKETITQIKNQAIL